MVDKEKYVQAIQDENLRNTVVKVLDKVDIVLRKHEIKTTDFLTPYEVPYIEGLLASFQEIGFILQGGYEGAERKVCTIFPEYLDPLSIEVPLACLKLRSNNPFNKLTHRDYLGSLLGLGIRRDKIGDIIVQDDYCQVILLEELKDYIQFHLSKIGNTTVIIKEESLENIGPVKADFKEISGTVSSLRLDAVLGLGLRISRSDAQALISKELVRVNWEVIDKNAYEIQVGDTLSVKGKGRMVVDEIKGTTKSGRIFIIIKKAI